MLSYNVKSCTLKITFNVSKVYNQNINFSTEKHPTPINVNFTIHEIALH
jgi:hypothetical protein